jgi:transposase
VPATSSPAATPHRPTGCARCCWQARTPTGVSPVPDSNDTVLAALIRRRCPVGADRAHAVRHAELRRLALAVRAGGRALNSNRAQLQAIVDDLVPGLTDRRGVGPVSAAQVIVNFSHPGRCRNEAAFAALAGTNPLEASSGRTVRHGLNHGGDRALNHAVHTIALTRMRCCATTRDYVTRRTSEGKTTREIRRCLKRYITRELYRTLHTNMITA